MLHGWTNQLLARNLTREHTESEVRDIQHFAEHALLVNYLNSRPERTASTATTNLFLLPGRRAGQPMRTTSLRLRLRSLSLPGLDAHTTAIHGLLRETPPFVVPWQRYAAGDHLRRQ
ncbi:hypothetical protein [Allokutzneria albata]|nr:hypothetical protein [Allokutzneria albata]